MLEKCTLCKGRILAGGHRVHHWTFCSDACWTNFQKAVAARVAPSETVAAAAMDLFKSACPVCGTGTNNDIYSSTRVTGMLVMYKIASQSILGCASCGRKHRLAAAGHCLLAGWWSIRAAFFNLFVLPTNLIAAAFIREPAGPSTAIIELVLTRIGEEAIPKLLSGELKLGDDPPESSTENVQG